MIVYVIHPFRGDGTPGARDRNRAAIESICRGLLALGHTPLSPVHCFGYLDDTIPEDRERAMQAVLELLGACDQAWVFGPAWTSEGCQKEIAEAMGREVPMRYLNEDFTLMNEEPA